MSFVKADQECYQSEYVTKIFLICLNKLKAPFIKADQECYQLEYVTNIFDWNKSKMPFIKTDR